MMMPFLALALITTQISVTARTAAGVDSYNTQQDQTVDIAMPTDRYSCVRMPLEQSNGQIAVMIACKEGGKPSFVLGATCSLTEADQSRSMLSFNVSKGATPVQVMFTVACQTQVIEGTRL